MGRVCTAAAQMSGAPRTHVHARHRSRCSPPAGKIPLRPVLDTSVVVTITRCELGYSRMVRPRRYGVWFAAAVIASFVCVAPTARAYDLTNDADGFRVT